MQFPKLKLLCPQQVLILKHLLLMVLLRRGFSDADMQGRGSFFRNDVVEVLKLLGEHALEIITVHGVTFEEGCLLPEIFRVLHLYLNYVIQMNVK